MTDSKPTKLFVKNLLYSINSAVGSDMFRHIYVLDSDGQEFDALQNGLLSCAFVVSGILALQGLVDRPHATVATTIRTMQEAGWYKVDSPQPGDVVHWPVGPEGHTHLGFYVKSDQYFSNSNTLGRPVMHKITLSDGRTPDAYYTHTLLRG